MLQDLSELDFDTYFDVATSNNASQQQQQTNDNTTTSYNIHSTPLSSPLNNEDTNNQLDMIHWNISSQLIADDHRSSPTIHISPISLPETTSTRPSPGLLNHQYNIKEETEKALTGLFTETGHCVRDIPGINIPSTPTTDFPTIMNNSLYFNLPSPSIERDPVIGTLNTINRRCYQEVHQSDGNTDIHETRNWIKPAIRLQLAQLGTIPNVIATDPSKKLKNVAHNAIERRYRNNINDHIQELKKVVPALYKAHIYEKNQPHDDSSDNSEDEEKLVLVDGVEVSKKLSKATILCKATEYIQSLKNTNESTEQENLILQQIITQMPGGNDILQHFLYQKARFEKGKEVRLVQERKELQARKKLERHRVLRERAAQRAALAQIFPKPERRPYRRRQLSNNTKTSEKPSTSSSTSTTSDEGPNRIFMVAFMCITLFSSSPFPSKSNHENVSNVSYATSSPLCITQNNTHYSIYVSLWYTFRPFIYTTGISCLVLALLFLRWLRPRPVVNRSKKCLSHHHYANEVPVAWNKLYSDLLKIVSNNPNAISKITNASLSDITQTCFDITCFITSFLIPRSLISLFYKSTKPTGCSEELSCTGAWIRLNEVECLGGNPDVTRLGMLHSCLGMLAQLHNMSREQHAISYESGTLDRVYTTTAIQLELCLPAFVSTLFTSYFWKKSSISHCPKQVLDMLAVRNGFSRDTSCRSVFYSFVLPYVTCPLDFVLYWQQLDILQQSWCDYLINENHATPVFTDKLVKNIVEMEATTTSSTLSYMLQWFIVLGQTLESLSSSSPEICRKHMETLTDYCVGSDKSIASHTPSHLLRLHQISMLHLLEAASLLQFNSTKMDQVTMCLASADKYHQASIECMEQISTSIHNDEASVLVISALVVRLKTLKALMHYKQRQHKGKLSVKNVSSCIADLRNILVQDMRSCYTQLLPTKCRIYLQSCIAQVDDTLY